MNLWPGQNQFCVVTPGCTYPHVIIDCISGSIMTSEEFMDGVQGGYMNIGICGLKGKAQG